MAAQRDSGDPAGDAAHITRLVGASSAPRGLRFDAKHIARLTRKGIVTRDALLDAGFTRFVIDGALRRGQLVRLHAGVYAVGHLALVPEARELAAVLASGPGAVASHRDATVLWDLLPRGGGPVHVTRTTPHRRSQPGIFLHHVCDHDRATRHGVPVTGAVRALVDLAASAPDELGRALNEALVARLLRPEELLTAAVGRPGAAALRAALAAGPTPTRSEAERELLRLVARAGLPRPGTNHRVCGYEVDALWADQHLVVEIDGYAAHGTRRAFERDRARDAELLVHGYRVIRITWRQLTTEPERIAAQLAVALTSWR